MVNGMLTLDAVTVHTAKGPEHLGIIPSPSSIQ